MSVAAKITSKGQVTVPKIIRDLLDSNIVEFDVIGNDIIIRPVRSVAGSLSSYSDDKNISFKEVRDQVWSEAVNGKKK
jgi:AbrB family looped-hinge helix DNA binding protein